LKKVSKNRRRPKRNTIFHPARKSPGRFRSFGIPLIIFQFIKWSLPLSISERSQAVEGVGGVGANCLGSLTQPAQLALRRLGRPIVGNFRRRGKAKNFILAPEPQPKKVEKPKKLLSGLPKPAGVEATIFPFLCKKRIKKLFGWALLGGLVSSLIESDQKPLSV